MFQDIYYLLDTEEVKAQDEKGKIKAGTRMNKVMNYINLKEH